MRVVALVLLALVTTARADTSVAVVAGGADSIRAQTERVVESWFVEHGLQPVKATLPKDGIQTLLNCLTLADMNCARGVVEARAKSGNVVAILEQTSGKKEKRSVQLSAYWIAKKRDVVSLQRTCDACTDDQLAKTLEAMIGDLARLAPTMVGKVHVTSDPPGLIALIDNQRAGKTPVDHEVSIGKHSIAVMRDGRVLAQKDVDVGPDASVDVDIPIPADPVVSTQPPPPPVKGPEDHPSKALPYAVTFVGVAAIATGAVLYLEGDPTGQSYYYRDTKPAGIATAAGGAVATVVGVIWLLKGGSSDSAPDVAVSSHSATFGWAGRF